MSRFARNAVLFLAAAVILGSLALVALGQPTPPPARAPEAVREEPVPEKGLKSRVFEVKHRDPYQLREVLRPLGSGSVGSQMVPSRDFGTISVRDFPENIAVIEEALKRLDRPETAQPDVELRLSVLVGTNADGDAAPPEGLKDVVTALRSTLQYRHYTLAGVFVQRAKDRTRRLEGGGATGGLEPPAAKGDARTWLIKYRIDSLGVEAPPSGPAVVRLDGFEFDVIAANGTRVGGMRTDLSLRGDEQVVVGTSTMKDSALIVVISSRVVR